MREIAISISNRNKNATPIQTIDAVKAAGFQKVFVQWYNESWEISQQEQLDYIRASGLAVLFAHLGYYREINCIWQDTNAGDSLVEKYIVDIDSCAKNAIPMVILHPVYGMSAPPCSEIGLRRLQKLAAYARVCGIKIAVENVFLKGYLEYILAHLSDDNLGVCFDSGHSHYYFDGDFDFSFCTDRVFAVHLHDNDKSGDQHLLPFDGTINWAPLVRSLQNSGYSGPVTLETAYQKEYLATDALSFYQKARERGHKLADLFDSIS